MHGFKVIASQDSTAALEKMAVDKEGLTATVWDLTIPHMDSVDTPSAEQTRLNPSLKVLLLSGFN